ncbi:MAG: PAS domain S-box protein [Chloroflexi bacterium]|nr:PAS domain S-box protein [Chloroflexota bacterium]
MNLFHRSKTEIGLAIKRWLAPPTFPGDEVKTRHANLLNMALIVNIALAFIVLIGNLLGGRTPIIISTANLGGIILGLFLRYWAFHGHLRRASMILITVDLIAITAIIADFGTIRTPTTGFHLLVVVGAGLLFDLKGMIVTTVLSSLSILGLIAAENAGWLPQPDYTVTITQWVTYTAMIGMAGGLTWMALQETRQALRRADKELAERKHVDEELKASERYVRRIIDSSIDMIITTDNERRVVEFNDAAQATFGYTREKILGAHIDRLYVRPSDGDAIRQAILRDGKFIGEVLNRRKNGETFESSLTASLLRDEHGKILGVVGISRDITERKRAEQARRQAEEKYQSIFNNAVEGFFQSTPDGRFISVNPALARMWDYDSQEDLLASITNIAQQVYADPSRRDQFRQLMDEQGELHGFEFQTRRKDGGFLWVSENARAVRDAAGAVLYYEGTIEDISARKQAEDALRTSEELYQSLVDVLPASLCRKDLQGRFIFGNKKYCDSIGLSLEELVGKTDYDIHPPELADKYVQDDRHVISTGQALELVEEHRTFHGDLHYVQVTKVPIRDATGTINGVQIMFWDITERKRAEEALRQSEERFSGAFEHAAIGMALVSPEGCFLKVNDALCQLTGYSETELLAKTFQDITHPEDLETDLSYARQLLAGKIHSYQMEKRYFHKSGQIVWIQLSGSLVRDARGDPVHFIAQIQDITARKRGELDLKQRADEFAALYDNSRDIIKVQDLDALLKTIVERAIHLLNASGGGMYIYDVLHDELEVKVATHTSIPIGTRLKLGEGMAGRVAQTRQPLIVDDYRNWPYRSAKYMNTTLTAIIEVPMLFGGELIGVLVVEEDRETTRKFTDEDARLLSLFAFQAASAIYNAQLFEKVRRRAEEFAALYDITHDLTLQQDLPSLLKTIVERATTLLGGSGGGIYLYDDERNDLEMVTLQGLGLQSGLRLKMGEGLAGQVAQTREPIRVDDYSQWEHRSPQYEGVPIRAAVQVPMLYGGQLIGVLSVHEIQTPNHKFTENDARILFLFAGQAASAVYDARLLDETRARARRQEALYHISTSLTYIRKPSELCQVVTQACRDFLNYAYLGIFLLDPATGDRVLHAYYGWQDIIPYWRFHPGEGLSDKAVRTGQWQYWSNVKAEPQYIPVHEGLRSEVDVPIKVGDSILGVLIAEDARENAFDEDDFEILQAVANQLAVALENARLYEEQKQLSITDSLTGLYNRRHFVELAQREFQRAHRLNSPCALLMLDLNDFKHVNDTYGHSAGDEALQLVAKMLVKNIRSIDVVARYGGDEFVILLPDCSRELAQQIAGRLEKANHRMKFVARDQPVQLSYSLGIGIATLAPDETLDDLLVRADSEMYIEKAKRIK